MNKSPIYTLNISQKIGMAHDCVVDIEIAASSLKKKLEKHHKKHCIHEHSKYSNNNNNNNNNSKNSNNKNYSQLRDDECTCGEARENVDQGKTSTVFLSPIINRKFDRREGVSEKNNVERKLVKEAIKVVARSTNMDDLNLL